MNVQLELKVERRHNEMTKIKTDKKDKGQHINNDATLIVITKKNHIHFRELAHFFHTS